MLSLFLIDRSFVRTQPPPMTEEAKAERREAALRAAEARTKNWGKKLNKGRQASQTKDVSNGVRDFAKVYQTNLRHRTDSL